MHVGLGPGHIVLDGDPAPLSHKGARTPIFGPYLLRPNSCVDQDATWYGGRPYPGDFVLDGNPAPPEKGAEPSIFGPRLCDFVRTLRSRYRFVQVLVLVSDKSLIVLSLFKYKY